MKTVYAEPLLLLNAALDYALLLVTGRICALPLRRWRLGLGALWGGVYAILALWRPGLFGLWTVRLLAGVLSVLIAYGAGRRTVRAALTFFAVSAALAGTLYALSALRGTAPGAGPLFPVSLPTLLLAFALGYAALSLGFHHSGRRAERSLREVTLTLRGSSVRFRALEDTGNELIDPVTGQAVLVVEAEALAPLFSDPAPLLLADPAAALEPLLAQGVAARLLPARGALGPEALLLLFRPECIEVDARERRDLAVAVSRARLCADGAYQAVIGPE